MSDNKVYVNSAWAGKADGSVVETKDGNAVIGTDAFATGDAAVAAFSGGGILRELVFLSGGSLSSLDGFSAVTLDANYCVTCSVAVPENVSFHIDGSDFANSTKRVFIAEGGFGDIFARTVTVDGGFGYDFLSEGNTLVITSSQVTDTFANTAWTETDVTDKFFGDELLSWEPMRSIPLGRRRRRSAAPGLSISRAPLPMRSI